MPAEDLLGVIEAMSRVVDHGRRRRDAGRNQADETRWRALGEALRACLDRGEPPSSARAREVAAAAREELRRFAEGDRATLDALARLRRLAPPEGVAGWDPPLFRYLDAALEALEAQEER